MELRVRITRGQILLDDNSIVRAGAELEVPRQLSYKLADGLIKKGLAEELKDSPATLSDIEVKAIPVQQPVKKNHFKKGN